MAEDEKQPKTLGRAYLVEKLRECGLSRRHAVRALNAVIDEMKEELWLLNEVEFPLGKLKPVQHRHRQQEGRFLGRKGTIYHRRWTVVHEMDAEGDKKLNPPAKQPRRLPSGQIVFPPRPGARRGEAPVVVDPQWRLRRPITLPPRPGVKPGK